MLDADNAERAGGSKRPRASRRVMLIKSDTEDDDPEGIVGPGKTESNDVGLDTDVDSEMVDVDAAEDAYAMTKAMGDRDREVAFISLFFLIKNVSNFNY